MPQATGKNALVCALTYTVLRQHTLAVVASKSLKSFLTKLLIQILLKIQNELVNSSQIKHSLGIIYIFFYMLKSSLSESQFQRVRDNLI